MGDHEVYERAVARDLDELDREPVPITKKLSEICREHPELRVWGINRRSFVVEFFSAEISCWYHDLDRTGSDNWNAWSCRCAEGQYQQFCIFLPKEIDE